MKGLYVPELRSGRDTSKHMNVSSLYIDSAIPGRYTVSAPYKTGAGRGNPKFNIEHNRAHAVFSCHEHCYAQIMVGRAGATSVGPGSMLTGISTPVRLATYMVVESLGGEFIEFNIGAVTMTTLSTHPFLNIEIVNGKAVTTSLSEYLKLLRLAGVPGYISRVAVNPATGIGVPEYTEEHNRAHAVFSCHEHCYAQIMVGRAGASKDAPGSSVTGYANPVRLTTSVIGVPCGEFLKLTEGGVK